jgi:hypothetical protein
LEEEEEEEEEEVLLEQLVRSERVVGVRWVVDRVYSGHEVVAQQRHRVLPLVRVLA